jgi:hypothetical protein
VQVAASGKNAQPVDALQLSAVHGLPSWHNAVTVPKQAPPLHWSPDVQASLSVQGPACGA